MIRRVPTRAPVAIAAVLLALTGASAFEGNVHLFAGQKWFVESDWEPVEEQPELGILLAFGETRSPIHFAIDVLAAGDEETFDDPVSGPMRIEGRTVEYGVGVRKVFRRQATFHPHLGAGGSLLTGRREIEVIGAGTTIAHDSSFGFWVDGGFTWRLGGHFNLGVDLRYNRANLDFGDVLLEEEVAGGGFHAGALVGYGW